MYMNINTYIQWADGMGVGEGGGDRVGRVAWESRGRGGSNTVMQWSNQVNTGGPMIGTNRKNTR